MADLPNFFIFGATKSGTSSLFFYLKQHPDVFMSSVKEPHFFGFEEGKEVWQIRNGTPHKNGYAVTDVQAYQALFKGATEKARGEASVMYIYLPQAAQRIHAALPDAKLIAVLRNPVERAFSAYLHMLRESSEPCGSFLEALEAEPGRIAEGWAPLYHYQAMGFYAEQLSRYDALFPREQIKLFLYEDLSSDPVKVAQDIYRFLGVRDDFVPDTQTRHNVSGVHQNKQLQTLHAFLKRDNPVKSVAKTFLPGLFRAKLKRRALAKIEAKNLSKPELEPKARKHLQTVYKDDILALQERLGRDLSHWLRA